VYPLRFVAACLAKFGNEGFRVTHEVIAGMGHMEANLEEDCRAVAHILRLQGRGEFDPTQVVKQLARASSNI
jgi:hypothetical protein